MELVSFSIVLFFTRVGYLLISSWEISDSTGKFILHPARADRISRERGESEQRRGKVYRGKLFFHRYCCSVVFFFFCVEYCGIFKYLKFLTFSTFCCHHQFGCIKETVGMGGGEEIENSIVDFYPPKSVGYTFAVGLGEER